MKMFLWLAFFASPLAFALTPCTSQSQTGSKCEIQIAQLRPTQFTICQLQVDATEDKLSQKNTHQLAKYLKNKEIPVVISPEDEFMLVDRHHLTKALWQMGVKRVTVKVIARLRNPSTFWRQMEKNHWTWLNNEVGLPLNPVHLPHHLAEMPDFPYRSLAGELQDAGFFEKNG